MSPPRPRIVTCTDLAPAAAPMSRSKGFDPLVIRNGRKRPVPLVTRHQAMAIWADLMARRAGTRDDAVLLFGVTFQTACNWFDGFVCPTGDKVMIAMRLWPEEFGLECSERRRAA